MYEDTKDLDKEIPVKNSNVIVAAKTTWIFERLPSFEGIPQTKGEERRGGTLTWYRRPKPLLLILMLLLLTLLPFLTS